MPKSLHTVQLGPVPELIGLILWTELSITIEKVDVESSGGSQQIDRWPEGIDYYSLGLLGV